MFVLLYDAIFNILHYYKELFNAKGFEFAIKQNCSFLLKSVTFWSVGQINL